MVNESVKLEILVASETAKDVEDLIKEKGWEREDGLRLLVGAGLMAVRLHPFEDNEDQTLPTEARTRWLKVEGNLAVVGFRLFEALEANRAWELSTGSIRKQNAWLENVLKQKQGEIEEFKKALAEKKRVTPTLSELVSGIETITTQFSSHAHLRQFAFNILRALAFFQAIDHFVELGARVFTHVGAHLTHHACHSARVLGEIAGVVQIRHVGPFTAQHARSADAPPDLPTAALGAVDAGSAIILVGYVAGEFHATDFTDE